MIPLPNIGRETSIKVGQIWTEVDPRFLRYIRIKRVTKAIVFTETVEWHSGSWVRKEKSRDSAPLKARFNGKRGGYALHKKGSS